MTTSCLVPSHLTRPHEAVRMGDKSSSVISFLSTSQTPLAPSTRALPHRCPSQPTLCSQSPGYSSWSINGSSMPLHMWLQLLGTPRSTSNLTNSCCPRILSSHLTTLGLKILSHKMSIIMVPTSQVVGRNKWVNT